MKGLGLAFTITLLHHHRHSKAAVGAVAATAIGDPAVFVSVDAMHQGPHGRGPVLAIVEVSDCAWPPAFVPFVGG